LWPAGFVALPAAFITYALCFGMSDEFGRHRQQN
jgi:hypothetical protein